MDFDESEGECVPIRDLLEESVGAKILRYTPEKLQRLLQKMFN